MKYKCPDCNAPIHSRRAGICASCRKPLPAEMLLTQAEIEALDKEMAESERKLREERERAGSSGLDGSLFTDGLDLDCGDGDGGGD